MLIDKQLNQSSETVQDLSEFTHTSLELAKPHETPRGIIEIPEHMQVSINGALVLAAGEQFSVGKSTLQRHAKRWDEAGEAAEVRSVKVTNRNGSFYRLHRESFVSWVLEQKEQLQNEAAPADPIRPQQVSPDPMRHIDEAAETPSVPTDTNNENERSEVGQSVLKIHHLETELDRALADKEFLQSQLQAKDGQIKDQTARQQEQNVMFQMLNTKLLAIAGGEVTNPAQDALELDKS